ncbi:MAG: glycosyltransferase [Desulfitobacteriaceae bacterium]|nr:glycosyltransferase [Desulfitobacteriaceae bacterium]MDD4400425.1 glycosyltransferase [Desulfitobacteriaceae bacterium]
MKKLRVLIFSATFGAGHVRAAEAIIEAIRAKEPGSEISHLDCGEFLNKTLNKVIKSTYIELIKHTPKLWGKFYYRTSKISPHSVFQRFLNRLGRREFLEYINSVQPDLIICTYPTVAGILAQLRLKQSLNIPLVTIVTDYAIHSQWIHPGVDLYVVGCKEVYEGLVSRGIEKQRIQIIGIPVSLKFEVPLDCPSLYEKLGLDSERLTLLVMGGAYGILEGAKWISKIVAESTAAIQAIIVCGRDQKLYKSLEHIISEARNPILLLGYVKNVEELMSVADLIITKAGGLTVSEALTKRLPMIIFKPIPGQEEANAVYVEKIGAGIIAETNEDLERILYRLIDKPQDLKKMRLAAEKAVIGHSAERAVNLILKLVDEQKIVQKIG